MSWYARSHTRKKVDSGKFRASTKLGTQHQAGGTYRDWQYDFVMHQSGTTVKRTKYAVVIRDSLGNRVDYLPDFGSLQQATAAAQRWIDRRHLLGRITAPSTGLIGSIPQFPAMVDSLSERSQEK